MNQSSLNQMSQACQNQPLNMKSKLRESLTPDIYIYIYIYIFFFFVYQFPESFYILCN